MPISTDLWRQYGRLAEAPVPDEVRRWAAHCVLDWYGVNVIGSRQELSLLLQEEYADSAGPASVVGLDRGAAVSTAALLNGAATHAIDYDDANFASHPAAYVLPAAYAVAQAEHRSGAEFLAAVLAGYELSYRVDVAMGRVIFAKGWHPTKALGVFGALAAAGTLMRLDEEEFGNAFGIAASLAGGLQANFGTMTKPLHAGLAAEAGITAARLGRRGITANPEALEAMGGLAELMGDGRIHEDLLAAERDGWVITRNIFKYHASCLGTHASIDAALKAVEGLRPEEIEHVRVNVNPNSKRICRFAYPTTGLEAKFSIEATTALAVLGDDLAAQDTFTDERVHRDDFVGMMARVEFVPVDGKQSLTSDVEIDTRDGRRLHGFHDSSIPAADVDRQEQRLIGKFLANATPALGASAADFAQRLLHVAEEPDIAGLVPRVLAAH